MTSTPTEERAARKHLPWNKWCVVEISMNSTNPIFRSVACSRGDGLYELVGHDEKIIVDANDLPHFCIVEEIAAMNVRKFPNQCKLPATVALRGK